MRLQILILMLAWPSGAAFAETPAEAATAYEQGLALKDCDPAAARKAFENADRQGHAHAAVNLGILHANGTGVPKDDSRAFSYFTKAAALGQREALYNKGVFLLEGRGVSRDLSGALVALEAAAAAGSVPAHIKLADLYYFGSTGLEKNHGLALPHVKAAAVARDAWACNILGTMAELGQGMKADRSFARYWLTVAAEQGHAKAQGNLGRMLRKGRPNSREVVESYKWLKLSSLQGIAMSTYQLGVHRRSMTSAQIAEGERQILQYNESRAQKSAKLPSLP